MKKILSLLFVVSALTIFGQTEGTIKLNGIPYVLNLTNPVVNYSVDQNQLVMIAGPQTDLFRDPNGAYNTDNAPRFMFQADSDFVLVASIELNFENQWDAGAIIVQSDSINWVKYCFEKDYTGVNRVVSVVTKQFSDDCNSVAVEGNKIFYKVAKARNAITLYCSKNGESWYLVRHTRFESKTKTKVGFLAQSPIGQQCKVKFEVIKYEAKTIADPFKGE